MKIETKDLVNVATKVLTEMGVDNFRDVKLTQVRKEAGEWLVSFSFRQEANWFIKYGSFAIDAETGEMRGMWLDRVWT